MAQPIIGPRVRSAAKATPSSSKVPPRRKLHSAWFAAKPGKSGRIRVRVIGKNGSGVANITVQLLAGNRRLEAATDSDGAAVFRDAPKARSVAFEVREYWLEAGPFKINPSHNDFYFEINGDAIPTGAFQG
jgi:hypothetical protein